jgi:hypothetical protein
MGQMLLRVSPLLSGRVVRQLTHRLRQRAGMSPSPAIGAAYRPFTQETGTHHGVSEKEVELGAPPGNEPISEVERLMADPSGAGPFGVPPLWWTLGVRVRCGLVDSTSGRLDSASLSWREAVVAYRTRQRSGEMGHGREAG